MNLTVFPDCGAPVNKSSVMLYDTAEQARVACGGSYTGAIAAHWPERV